MKSYHEVAEDVFHRRDVYVQKQRSKQLVCKRVSTVVLAVVFAAALLSFASLGYAHAVREGIIDDVLDYFQTTIIAYEVTDDGRIKEKKLPNWGITLSSANVTPTGMTLICTQSGGNAHGQLMTGQAFYLEVKTDAGWVGLQAKDDSNFWNISECEIPENGTVSWALNWEDMYGALAPGTYRLRKPFWEGHHTQDTVCYHFKVEFTVTVSDSENAHKE